MIEISFSKLKLNKVWADTILGNDSSKKVLEKCKCELEEDSITYNIVGTVMYFNIFIINK